MANLIRDGIFRYGITELVQKPIEGPTNFPFFHTRRVPLVTSHPAYKTSPSATFPLGLRHQRKPTKQKKIFHLLSQILQTMVAVDVNEKNSGSSLKFLCSYGGRILPRSTDGKLRYVGGHTRVLSVHRSISFEGPSLLSFFLPLQSSPCNQSSRN